MVVFLRFRKVAGGVDGKRFRGGRLAFRVAVILGGRVDSRRLRGRIFVSVLVGDR